MSCQTSTYKKSELSLYQVVANCLDKLSWRALTWSWSWYDAERMTSLIGCLAIISYTQYRVDKINEPEISTKYLFNKTHSVWTNIQDTRKIIIIKFSHLNFLKVWGSQFITILELHNPDITFHVDEVLHKHLSSLFSRAKCCETSRGGDVLSQYQLK